MRACFCDKQNRKFEFWWFAWQYSLFQNRHFFFYFFNHKVTEENSGCCVWYFESLQSLQLSPRFALSSFLHFILTLTLSPSASVCISYNSPLYWKQVALRDGKVWERKKGGLGWWTRVSLLLWEHLEAKGVGLFSFTEDIISFFIINPGNQDCCKDRWDSLHDCAVHLAGLLFHLDIYIVSSKWLNLVKSAPWFHFEGKPCSGQVCQQTDQPPRKAPGFSIFFKLLNKT